MAFSSETVLNEFPRCIGEGRILWLLDGRDGPERVVDELGAAADPAVTMAEDEWERARIMPPTGSLRLRFVGVRSSDGWWKPGDNLPSAEDGVRYPGETAYELPVELNDEHTRGGAAWSWAKYPWGEGAEDETEDCVR